MRFVDDYMAEQEYKKYRRKIHMRAIFFSTFLSLMFFIVAEVPVEFVFHVGLSVIIVSDLTLFALMYVVSYRSDKKRMIKKIRNDMQQNASI